MHKVQIKDYLPYLDYKLDKAPFLRAVELEILAVRYQQVYGSTEVYTDDLEFFKWFNDNQ